MNVYIALAVTAVFSFLISFGSGFVVIPWLKKLKFGQNILLEDGPVWHKSKQGTPTMGGIMFVVSIVLSVTAVLITDKILGGNLFAGETAVPDKMKVKLVSAVILAIGFGIIGFADDYIKVVKKRNLGLTIMLGYLITLYINGLTYIKIPFVGAVELKWFFWIFGIAVIYGTVNAANFTDGVDGLCASVTSVIALAFVIAALMSKFFGISILASALLGGCLGYYIWNRYPSKVMMGDTGSLFLGGLVAGLAYAIDCPLILLLFAVIYVIEAMSDVLQIGYFKATHGKRIFKMAPIHHHFEMSGWKEKKIVAVFTLVNIIGCALGIVIYYYGVVAVI